MSTLASNRLHIKPRTALSMQQENNVAKRVKEENRLRHQMGVEHGMKKAAQVSNWQDNGSNAASKSSGARMTESRRKTLRAASEEYVAERRAELRQKLERDRTRYERELADRGLLRHRLKQ
ncbi:hypothetical protein DFJ77DRAFT_463823 [Powellomyces hirtus]|nr:hypothetical protein DFJ77DRAFT_463823 [Powellomyces hirtus]